MLKEFKEFAMHGNVMDMAVGIVIGAAFGTIVKSLVEDIIMPPVGMLLGNVDFANLFIVLKEGAVPAPYESLELAKGAGAITINYGMFISTIVSFLIVVLALFFVIKAMNRLKTKEVQAPVAPTTKNCPKCAMAIPITATRCPHCTSELGK